MKPRRVVITVSNQVSDILLPKVSATVFYTLMMSIRYNGSVHQVKEQIARIKYET